jgi:hypothetical protein
VCGRDRRDPTYRRRTHLAYNKAADGARKTEAPPERKALLKGGLAEQNPPALHRPRGRPDPVLGYRDFTDGRTRPVHACSRQYVVDDDGQLVYGLWLRPEEEKVDLPVIVEGEPPWAGTDRR